VEDRETVTAANNLLPLPILDVAGATISGAGSLGRDFRQRGNKRIWKGQPVHSCEGCWADIVMIDD
jgi:hypothetical protein